MPFLQNRVRSLVTLLSLVGILLSLSTVVGVSLVSAHTNISDTTNVYGAFLHISPDDSPIAGKVSTVHLDAEDIKPSISGATLTVTNDQNLTTNVPLSSQGTIYVGDYTFPVQGLYKVTFTLKTEAGDLTFNKDQQVTRGITASSGKENLYLIIIAGLVLVLVIVVMVGTLLYFRHNGKTDTLRKS